MTENPNKAALKRMTRARTALIINQPFWGCLSLHLELVEDSSRKTMATDGKKLLYSPEFVLSLPEPELVGVVAHEVEHVARLHHTRRGRRDAKLWNIAGDFCINGGLLAGGFRLPKERLHDPKYDGMSTEQIYAILEKEEIGKRQGAGGAGRGGNGDGEPDHSGFGEVLDACAPEDGAARAAIEAEVQTQTRQAAMVAKAHGAGTMPGAVEEIIKDLDAPRVSWRDLLRRFADDSSLRDSSWRHPNRRYASIGLILPGSVAIAPAHLVAIVDTSGSMDEAALKAIGGELQAVLDEGAAEKITVVYADTKVQRTDVYETGDIMIMNAAGRGGTMFSPALAWVGENCPDAAAIVYLTDLDCNDFGPEPETPVLWACTGPARAVPFGEVIVIDPNV